MNDSLESYIQKNGMTPAQVLLAIRENGSMKLGQLYGIASGRWGMRSPTSMPLRLVRGCVGALLDSGLIVQNDDEYTVSPNLEKIQATLGFSLKQLANQPFFGLTVEPIFGEPTSLKTPPDIFVLMPFSPDLQPVYEDHLVKTAQRATLTVARADDFFTTGSIVSDIWGAILSSKLIIADCTGRNPNVFYEVGIAHTVGKKTILIAQDINDIPFDLRHIRCIIYQYTPRGMQEFDEKLFNTIKSA